MIAVLVPFLLAFFVFGLYICITSIVFEQIPKSISETYYLWKRVKAGWVFTAMMWSTAGLLLYPWTLCSEPGTEGWAVFSCGAMIFVGCAAQFKESLTNIVHYSSAGVWATCAVVWTVLNHSCTAIIVGGALGLFGFIMVRRSFTFFAELACALMMIVAIAINLAEVI